MKAENKIAEKTYPSAVDAWLAALLIGIPITLITVGINAYTANPNKGLFLIVEGCLVLLPIVALTIPCKYIITAETLIVRCGVMTTDISLEAIGSVELSRNITSAPALSLKRVKVQHGAEHVLISPKDRERFIADLTEAVRVRRAALSERT